MALILTPAKDTYFCMLETDQGVIVSHDNQEYPVHIKVPVEISSESIQVGNVEVEFLDETQFKHGLVGGWWSKFKSWVKKTVTTVITNEVVKVVAKVVANVISHVIG